MATTGMPLSRYRVLDLTRVRSGPTCVRQLADWGADVIKVEAPPDGKEGLGGARDGFDFQNLHRNKRSLTLNLKAPEGLAVFYKLIEQADVVVENFRADVKNRLKIDMTAWPRSTLASFWGRFPASGRTGLMPTGPDLTRSPKAWAA